MQKKRRRKTGNSRMAIVAGIVVLMVVFAAMFLLQPDDIADEVVVEAGTGAPSARQFLLEDEGEVIKYVTDLNTINFAVPGEYPVELSYREKTYESTIVVRDTVAPTGSVQNLAAYSNEKPQPEDFVTEMYDVTKITVSFAKAPDMKKEGSRVVTIVLTDEGGNQTRLEAALTVFHDVTAPVLSGVAPMYAYQGTQPDYFANVTAKDDYDMSPVILVDDQKVDMNTLGTYDITYKTVDEAGNEANASTTLTVTDDNQAPAIQGVHEIAVYIGSTVSYRSGIRVVDDKDPNPKLEIDSSRVDLSKPGTYTLVYRATDMTGNAAQQSVTVKVEEKPATFVELDVINAKADELLKRIVSDTMTDKEKVQAIYSYVRSSYGYSGHSVKTDWYQGAWFIMDQGQGDCFNYFAVTKLLLDRLGIPNIDVRKVRNFDSDSDHYWSLVSVDGGETYYHLDTTPRIGEGDDFCLVTDAFLDAYSAAHKNCHNRDKSLYPATPTE